MVEPSKRCFVISPIGAEGSEIREHADDVFDYIIRPAMEECGMEAVRSDHLHEPGLISDQMFAEILGDDLCIAVLTFFNPNVFYELAVAQAAGRPAIILLQKGLDLPFDIKDLRCVAYDLKPRPLFDRVYVKEIVEHVKGLERAKGRTRSLFGEIAYFGGPSTDMRFFPQGKDFGGSDAWLALLQETEHVFEIMGVGLRSWRRTEGFADALVAKAAAGCAARILLMDPENPVLRHFNAEAQVAADWKRTQADIDAMYAFFASLAEQAPTIEIRRIARGFTHYQITRTDRWALTVVFAYSQSPAYNPLWQSAAGTAPYDAATREFEALWRLNAPDAEA